MYLTGLGLEVEEFKEGIGNQFSVRLPNNRTIYISPKTLRLISSETGYTYISKDNWHNKLDENFYLALVLISKNEFPDIYLIPAPTWREPNKVFVDMNYEKEGLKSKAEWGIRVSEKNMKVIKQIEIKTQLQLPPRNQ
jgi:hypothetical protein